MALADFHSRAALAAAQVVEGFDEDAFRDALQANPVGIAFGSNAATTAEGRALLDLLVRLLARLYPVLEIRCGDGSSAEKEAEGLCELALSINPMLEFGEADLGVSVGEGAPAFGTSLFAGSSGWNSLFSTDAPRPIGDSANPFGAGAAACIAAANLFRLVFFPDGRQRLDATLVLSTYNLERRETTSPSAAWELGEVVLVGAGAIGNAAVWAFGRGPLTGKLHIVDHESVELSNLQRYVLAGRNDVSASKVELVSATLAGELSAVPHELTWQRFVTQYGYNWETVAVGVDNAPDRVAVQASLPRSVLNAWTQPGDLGVSLHPRFGHASDACLACLYLPTTATPNEDEIVAQALGVSERVREVRDLLDTQNPLERPFLEAVAGALGRSLDLLIPFEGRGIRELYVRGVCGGAVIPLGATGMPPQQVHVPLAHQSALAGVLLAAQVVRLRQVDGPIATSVTTIDLTRPLSEFMTMPRERHPGKRCLCADADFLSVYRRKWGADAGSP